MTQQQIIANLKVVRRDGVNLANMGRAANVLIDAVIYLVENTPEVKK